MPEINDLCNKMAEILQRSLEFARVLFVENHFSNNIFGYFTSRYQNIIENIGTSRDQLGDSAFRKTVCNDNAFT